MSTVVNPLKVSPGLIKPAYSTHSKALPLHQATKKNGYVRLEEMDRDEYVAYMKANPRSWGMLIPQYNAYEMRKGWVNIYDRTGAFSRSLFFQSVFQKRERVKEAMRSIRHLPGAYIEISHAE